MNKIFFQIKRFLEIPFAEKKLLLEAVCFLFTAKILLFIFPFKFCLRFIKSKYVSNSNLDEAYLTQIKIAIDKANKLAFWKNVCLVNSFTARWMLQRRKIASQLSIGVTHDKNKNIIAHAWVKVNDFEIISKGLDYKELISF
jgi:hypothetical protein